MSTTTPMARTIDSLLNSLAALIAAAIAALARLVLQKIAANPRAPRVLRWLAS